MNKKTGIFIPARLNSERFPNKLIKPIGDTNLFDIACQKLNKLPEDINKYALVYDEELVDIATNYKNIKIVKRDKETVNVDGPLTYIFKELEYLEDDYLMFLNPCLAFLKKKTILKSIKRFNSTEFRYATSVKLFKNWLFKKREDGGSLNHIDYKGLSTKDITPLYQAAHCFHIFDKNKFFENGLMLSPRTQLIEVPEEETIDVDTEEDYKYVKWKYEYENSN